MKKTLIICFGFDIKKPGNANAICIRQILEYLDQNRNITVVTETLHNKLIIEQVNNVTICKIPITKNKGNKKYNFKKWGKDVFSFILNELEYNQFHSLLTVSFPFNMHFIGKKLKLYYPSINWIVYELDPYAYNYILRLKNIAFFLRYLQERNVIKHANKVFLTHELYKLYNNNLFARYKDKFVDVGIPLLKLNNENTFNNSGSKRVKLLYTGTFYNKIRNPQYMFKIIDEVLGLTDCELHVYGPSTDEASKYDIMNKHKVNFHGRVSIDEIDLALKKADILINIGNAVPNQLPSKVLEYISTGKPIINFYSIEDDTSKYYLDFYPNALSIRNDDLTYANTVRLVSKFIESNQGRPSLAIDELNKVYNYFIIENVVSRINKHI